MSRLGQPLDRDPDIDFALVLTRVRRIAQAGNNEIADTLRIPTKLLKRIDEGSVPDFSTGSALVKLLQQLGGNLNGLTR
jgi:hypothetical protein